ncbi:hypothetical protein M422DRAFT_38389 [Sphaerobolus stellatus SS14]|uniref:Uncharacterized protein n=1 Tax=Sphaerobolus stellatus (strain SS14) TaxID=990650 RepID=A0A0C9TW27_SPHS4|nr:hypothetical protein M422DRAFT_38389 [Sphaerobolus stellatus SS14]
MVLCRSWHWAVEGFGGREEVHHTLTNDKLVRRRTQAHGQAVAAGRVNNANHAPTAAEKVKMKALEGTNSSEAPPAPVMPATLPPLNNARPRHASTMPSGQAGGPPPPQQQGGPQQERPFANAPRYTLSDTPSPPPAGTAVASHPRVAGRPPGRRHETVQHVGGVVGSPAPPVHSYSAPSQAHGPATLAEMGFQVGKAEEKDRVII